jgi:N-acetylneuraminate synthase/sialic acid synthase
VTAQQGEGKSLDERRLVIDGAIVDDTSECYVIAEIGHNHQGSIETARQLIRAAKECGATAVKLQKRDNRALYTAQMYNKPYDHENSFGPTYGLHREALEFGRAEYQELQACARELGVTLFATPFDLASADFLAELDVPAYKLASGDLKNLPLLTHVARFGRPVIISTGAATLEDVRRAYDAVIGINPQVALLQCTAAYPAAFGELDLAVITTFRHLFPSSVIGYSGHDNGIAMAVAAYVLGARIVEKHFTLNRAMKGTDHAFSLEPVGMRKMVRDLRRVREAMGDGCKKMYPTEAGAYLKMGKKLVAARMLQAGECLGREDIAIRSPGDGLAPYEIDRLIGAVLRRSVGMDETLALDMFASMRSADRSGTSGGNGSAP